MLERIELARSVPGEKLFTKLLVDTITEILQATRTRKIEGNIRETTYTIDVGQTGLLFLIQGNRPHSSHPDLLIASMRFYPDGRSSSLVSIEGISQVTNLTTHKSIDFILETPTHIQTVYINSTGYYSSDTFLKDS